MKATGPAKSWLQPIAYMLLTNVEDRYGRIVLLRGCADRASLTKDSGESARWKDAHVSRADVLDVGEGFDTAYREPADIRISIERLVDELPR